MELETHIQISNRLNYLDEKQASGLLAATAEIGKMINGLRSSLVAQSKEPNPES